MTPFVRAGSDHDHDLDMVVAGSTLETLRGGCRQDVVAFDTYHVVTAGEAGSRTLLIYLRHSESRAEALAVTGVEQANRSYKCAATALAAQLASDSLHLLAGCPPRTHIAEFVRRCIAASSADDRTAPLTPSRLHAEALASLMASSPPQPAAGGGAFSELADAESLLAEATELLQQRLYWQWMAHDAAETAEQNAADAKAAAITAASAAINAHRLACSDFGVPDAAMALKNEKDTVIRLRQTLRQSLVFLREALTEERKSAEAASRSELWPAAKEGQDMVE